MSKGHGRTERAILAALEIENMNTLTLTGVVYEVPKAPDGMKYVTNAQYAAVRRALLRLKAEGLVWPIYRLAPHAGGGINWSNKARAVEYAKKMERQWGMDTIRRLDKHLLPLLKPEA